MRLYIILGNGFAWLPICYMNVKNNENILIVNKNIPYQKNGILGFCAKVTYSIKKRTDRIYMLPFRKLFYKGFSQSLWIKRMSHKYPIDGLVFVIYDQNRLDADFSFTEYLRKKYKGCKIVYVFSNVVDYSHLQYNYGKVNQLKEYYDNIIAFDRLDSKKYGFDYSYLVHSKKYKRTEDIIYDCIFVGAAKDRLDEIYRVYHRLKELGLKVLFYINKVEEKKEIECDDIVFNHILSYSEVMDLVFRSRCILDIMQGGSQGVTLRVSEAVVFKKKLISNNQSLRDEPFYNSNILCYKAIEDITLDFFNNELLDYSYDYLFSPEHFLDEHCTKKNINT